MVEYYFDIETYSPGEKPNVAQDKIITIQYRELSPDGNPRGELQILTEWGCGSEKALLDAFGKVFFTENAWDFVPVGFNLYGFDLLSLLSRYNHHFGTSHGLSWFYDKPVLDIKPVLVIMGRGFKGCGDIFGKQGPNPIKGWYESGRFEVVGPNPILIFVLNLGWKIGGQIALDTLMINCPPRGIAAGLAWSPLEVRRRASSDLKPHGRYPFKTYATLVLIVSLFAVVNTVFTNLLQKIVGNWDFGSVLILTLGLLFFALLFAPLFWIADTSGTIGRLLGARDTDK